MEATVERKINRMQFHSKNIEKMSQHQSQYYDVGCHRNNKVEPISMQRIIQRKTGKVRTSHDLLKSISHKVT